MGGEFQSHMFELLHEILTSQSDHFPLSHPNTSEMAHFGLSYLCQMSPHTNLQCHACHIEVQIAKTYWIEKSLLMTSISENPSDNERPISCITDKKKKRFTRKHSDMNSLSPMFYAHPAFKL